MIIYKAHSCITESEESSVFEFDPYWRLKVNIFGLCCISFDHSFVSYKSPNFIECNT